PQRPIPRPVPNGQLRPQPLRPLMGRVGASQGRLPLLHRLVPRLVALGMQAVKRRRVPCSIQKAREYVDALHRHHGSSTSALFALACADETGLIRGVVLVGRPVARILDDGWTLEVTRVATDGRPNA